MTMRPKALLSATAGVLLLVALVVVVQARFHARVAVKTSEAVIRQQADARQALRRAEGRIAAAQTLAEAGGAPVVSELTQPHESPGAQPTSDHERVARTIPELQALRLAADRTRFEITYAPLFRGLKLSPTQVAQFCDLLMWREEMKSDLQAAAEVQRLPDDDAAIRRLGEQAERKYEEAQRALLGEAGTRQTIEFERTMKAREAVAVIAATSTLGGTPLTKEQTERLLGVVVAAAPWLPDGTMDGDKVDWTAVDVQAREFLSPAQWTILTSVETDALARFSAQLEHAMDRARQRDEQRTAGAERAGR